MKQVWVACIAAALTAQSALAADLYRVELQSQADARYLQQQDVVPVLRVGNTYLVFGDADMPGALERGGLAYERIGTDVEPGELALDRDLSSGRRPGFPVLFARDQIRLFRVPRSVWDEPQARLTRTALPESVPRVVYADPAVRRTVQRPTPAAVDSVWQDVSEDSVISYLTFLESLGERVAGTVKCHLTRDYLLDRFQDYGYDSVYADHFIQYLGGFNRDCYNVIAVKEGSVYPEIEIVVGAHHDGVTGSPAVDDNGSGVAGVLEMARILSTVTTCVTFKFVTFDAEEWGLYGSWRYAAQAAASGDSIMVMFNMDMIGHLPNDQDARLFYGASAQYAQQWINVGGPLTGITGHLAGHSGGSDHHPFDQMGFDVVFLHEYIFSSVYHSPNDLLIHFNSDYATRMIAASAGALWTLSEMTDFDGDGVVASVDNCPGLVNPGQDDYDLDGRGDLCDACPALPLPGDEVVRAGDVDESDVINSADIVYLVAYVFKGGPEPQPEEYVGDVNCDGVVVSGDIIYMVNYVFKGGDAPCDPCALP